MYFAFFGVFNQMRSHVVKNRDEYKTKVFCQNTSEGKSIIFPMLLKFYKRKALQVYAR